VKNIDVHLKTDRELAIAHPLFRRVNSLRDIQIFMSNHVFAVWDFMSLLKTLQRDLTCTTVPWFPPRHPEVARLINEIVLGEETDEAEPGIYGSHFELYRKAMVQAGSSTQSVDRMIDRLSRGVALTASFDELPVAPNVAKFVHTTLTICAGSTHEVAAAFFYGREDVIPEMFERALEAEGIKNSKDYSLLELYMRRHIEMDGDSHGPRARRILEILCEDDDLKWDEALAAARLSLQARKHLWDGILEVIENSSKDESVAREL
jgi:hypothetical protein